MSLLDLLPTSQFGYQGKKPGQFDLGPNSTLDFNSSINNTPTFATYADPYLRGRVPTRFGLGGKTPARYLDNPPK